MRKILFLSLVACIFLPVQVYSHNFSRMSDEEVAYYLYHPSTSTKAAAAGALGLRNYAKAIPVLVEMCYDSKRQVRTAAIKALGMMKTYKALDTYYFIIWDESGYFTVWDKMSAVWAMGNYPDINVRSLIDVLDMHPDFKVALQAARSLEKRPEWEAQTAILQWKDILEIFPY